MLILRRAARAVDAMTDYHEDSKCGSCGGPLEAFRDVICETCVPEETWFAMAAQAQDIAEAMAEEDA